MDRPIKTEKLGWFELDRIEPSYLNNFVMIASRWLCAHWESAVAALKVAPKHEREDHTLKH